MKARSREAHLDAAVAAANRSGSRAPCARAKSIKRRQPDGRRDQRRGDRGRLGSDRVVEAENLPDSVVTPWSPWAVAAGTSEQTAGRTNLSSCRPGARDNDLGAVHRALNNRANCLRALWASGGRCPTYDEMVAHTAAVPAPLSGALGRTARHLVALPARPTGRRPSGTRDRFARSIPSRHYLETQVRAGPRRVAFARGTALRAMAFAAALSNAREGLAIFSSTGRRWRTPPGSSFRTAGSRSSRAGRRAPGLPPARCARQPTTGFDRLARGRPRAEARRGNLSDLMFNHRINRAISDGRLTTRSRGSTERGRRPRRRMSASVSLTVARGGDDPEPWLSEAESFYRGVGARRYLARDRGAKGYPPQRLNDTMSPTKLLTPPTATGRTSKPSRCRSDAAIAALGPLSQTVTTGRSRCSAPAPALRRSR